MTFLENRTEKNTKNIILECSSKITFDDVSENLKRIIRTINKSYFKKEYVFLNIDSFYEFKGTLIKENYTEQYFIIFFKNKEEFEEMIKNPHIDIETINKKDIHFIYVIPNNFIKISENEKYELFSHIYLDIREKTKWIGDKDNLPATELLSKSGFKELSPIIQIEMLKDFELSDDELALLRFSGTLSADVEEYYTKNIYKQKNKLISKFKNKLLTIF